MKKTFQFLVLISLFCSPLYSADGPGKGSIDGANATQNESWQNWAFIGTSIALVVIGLYVVSISPGTPVHDKH